jgi:hypothetical protein
MLHLLGGDRSVIAIDPVVRAEVRTRFSTHPHARWIELVEGSTIDEATLTHVRQRISGRGPGRLSACVSADQVPQKVCSTRSSGRGGSARWRSSGCSS